MNDANLLQIPAVVSDATITMPDTTRETVDAVITGVPETLTPLDDNTELPVIQEDDGDIIEDIDVVRPVAGLFGALPANGVIPFVSENAGEVITSPVQGQKLTLYELFLGAYVYCSEAEPTRRTSTINIDSPGRSVDGLITAYELLNTTTLDTNVQSLPLLGSVHGDSFVTGDPGIVRIPYIDIRAGEALTDDVPGSLVNIRIRGFTLNDSGERLQQNSGGPTFDTKTITLAPKQEEFRVRLYPYILLGTQAYYVPLIIAASSTSSLGNSYLRITVDGVEGLVNVTIPGLTTDERDRFRDGMVAGFQV